MFLKRNPLTSLTTRLLKKVLKRKKRYAFGTLNVFDVDLYPLLWNAKDSFDEIDQILKNRVIFIISEDCRISIKKKSIYAAH